MKIYAWDEPDGKGGDIRRAMTEDDIYVKTWSKLYANVYANRGRDAADKITRADVVDYFCLIHGAWEVKEVDK